MTSIKMDPTLKASWVAALRSNQYEQYCGGLQAPSGQLSFCCLGVLDYENAKTQWYEVANRLAGQTLDHDAYGLSTDLQDFLAIANDGVSNTKVFLDLMDRLGFATHPQLDIQHPSKRSFNGQKLLPAASFASIANWIEENL